MDYVLTLVNKEKFLDKLNQIWYTDNLNILFHPKPVFITKFQGNFFSSCHDTMVLLLSRHQS